MALRSATLVRVFASDGTVVLGIDPGIRTGCKVAVVDATGKLLETATIYPHQPRNDWDGSLATLARMVLQHGVQLISIGNGTASRETDKLAIDLVKLVARHKPEQKMAKIVVSEAGASVYSASAFAAAEFPDLDVSLRGAVSIARRLQDPLAELVKIDPKSIGVGQYQHDVSQTRLARTLDAVVEDFKKTLDKFRVPSTEQAELTAILAPMRADIVTRTAKAAAQKRSLFAWRS